MRHFAVVWDGNNAICGFTSAEDAMASEAAKADYYLDWVELSPASAWVTETLGDDPGQISVEGMLDLTSDALAGDLVAPTHLLVAELSTREAQSLLAALVIAGESELADKLAGLIA